MASKRWRRPWLGSPAWRPRRPSPPSARPRWPRCRPAAGPDWWGTRRAQDTSSSSAGRVVVQGHIVIAVAGGVPRGGALASSSLASTPFHLRPGSGAP
jgi:hypothetical protein